MKKFTVVILLLLLFYTRFVGLDWGFPYPMHPDERNMAVAVEQMSCPSLSSPLTCFNPHFFAYGQFPLYLAFGGVQLYHLIVGQQGQPTFLEATYALRIISALSSIFLVFVLLKIMELVFPIKKNTNLQGVKVITLIFFIFQPYAIQFAHFGTTESLLMLLYALIVYYSLKLLITPRHSPSILVFLGMFSGIALGTKTSSLLFLGLPVLIILLKLTKKKIIYTCISLLTYVFVCLLFFTISSPQSLLNWNDFLSSMNYESAVGMGTYVPFYTRQFVGTIPVIFQFQKILPYVLGWPQLILSILGFIFLPSYIVQFIRQGVLTEHTKRTSILFDILRFALLLSLLPSSFFFAKWTRFIAPSFPLFSLFAIIFLLYSSSTKKLFKGYIWGIFLIAIIPGILFLSIYTSPDVRFTASEWMYKNIPENSKILSETANVIDIPISSPGSYVNAKNYLLNSFNFYDLDFNQSLQLDLSRALKEADYILIPSRRIFKNHPQDAYPKLAEYYSQLNSKQFGFEKVAEFSSYPKIELLGKTIISFPDENAEETWTVFDHPVIRIYKRIPTTPSQSLNQLDFSHYQTTSYTIEGKNYKLLIADTPEKWERGLMYVKNKGDIHNLDGMIFTFPDSESRMFWNKNTLSHLTLYWIRDNKIMGASDLPSITESGTIYTVSSPTTADTVIEIIK